MFSTGSGIQRDGKNSNEGIEGTQKGFAHGSKEVAKARRGPSDFFDLFVMLLLAHF
jgi:hypothetical protein